MDGVSLLPVVENDTPIRQTALFGIHGGHVNITDGRYVYMHAPVHPDGNPLYEYTLMPMHMNAPYAVKELQDVSLTKEFAFTKGCCVMKIPANNYFNAFWYGTMLFDLENDPQQCAPIQDKAVQLRLLEQMRKMMQHNQAPKEQYERLGIPQQGEFTEQHLLMYQNAGRAVVEGVDNLDAGACRAAAIFLSYCDAQKGEQFKQALRSADHTLTAQEVVGMIQSKLPAPAAARMTEMIRNYM